MPHGNTAMATVLALCFLGTAPCAIEAIRTLAAGDDPVQLADLALDRAFNAVAADREIRTALTAGNPELAQSCLELARERAVEINPDLATRADADMEAYSSLGSTAWRFARGVVAGDQDDMAGIAGTAVGDVLVIGDVRDAAREGLHMLRGEEANRLVLGLSLGGLAVTAGTFASFGLAAPARAGVSIVKAAGKTEWVGARLLRLVRWEKPVALAQLATDVGTIEAKAGGRAALEAVRLAEEPKDVAKFARLAVAKGGKTRAILKFLGRGAIVAAASIFDLVLAILTAVANFILFCAMLKWRVEHATRRVIRRRKARRARVAAVAAAQAA